MKYFLLLFLCFLGETASFSRYKHPTNFSQEIYNARNIFLPLNIEDRYSSELLQGDSSLIRETSVQPQSINYTRLSIIGGIYLGGMTAIHIYQQNAWWKDWRQPFHVRVDVKYGKNNDKIGHTWAGNFFSYVISQSFEWSGMEEGSSIYSGAVLGSLFQLYVEVEDGYSQWGFDPVDATADVLGAFYPVIQRHVPLFQNFDLKASYYPRDLGQPGGIKGQTHIIPDDYEGQTFWIGWKRERMLPQKIEVIPSFLSIALGYSVRNLGKANEHSIVLVGFDVDLQEIIPQDTWAGKTLSKLFNFYHLPLPAIQVYPKFIGYGLYF